ncbi:Adenylate cyclase type 10 [Phlyctochytrium bullatum]|nr:Adenylate cyclase type 10 [Phlyctochytrium bullatum]
MDTSTPIPVLLRAISRHHRFPASGGTPTLYCIKDPTVKVGDPRLRAGMLQLTAVDEEGMVGEWFGDRTEAWRVHFVAVVVMDAGTEQPLATEGERPASRAAERKQNNPTITIPKVNPRAFFRLPPPPLSAPPPPSLMRIRSQPGMISSPSPPDRDAVLRAANGWPQSPNATSPTSPAIGYYPPISALSSLSSSSSTLLGTTPPSPAFKKTWTPVAAAAYAPPTSPRPPLSPSPSPTAARPSPAPTPPPRGRSKSIATLRHLPNPDGHVTSTPVSASPTPSRISVAAGAPPPATLTSVSASPTPSKTSVGPPPTVSAPSSTRSMSPTTPPRPVALTGLVIGFPDAPFRLTLPAVGTSPPTIADLRHHITHALGLDEAALVAASAQLGGPPLPRPLLFRVVDPTLRVADARLGCTAPAAAEVEEVAAATEVVDTPMLTRRPWEWNAVLGAEEGVSAAMMGVVAEAVLVRAEADKRGVEEVFFEEGEEEEDDPGRVRVLVFLDPRLRSREVVNLMHVPPAYEGVPEPEPRQRMWEPAYMNRPGALFPVMGLSRRGTPPTRPRQQDPSNLNMSELLGADLMFELFPPPIRRKPKSEAKVISSSLEGRPKLSPMDRTTYVARYVVETFQDPTRRERVERCLRGEGREFVEVEEMAVVIVDITGYTAITSALVELLGKASSEAVSELVGEYMKDICSVVLTYGGDIFLGDAILVTFSPTPSETLSTMALRALRCCADLLVHHGTRETNLQRWHILAKKDAAGPGATPGTRFPIPSAISDDSLQAERSTSVHMNGGNQLAGFSSLKRGAVGSVVAAGTADVDEFSRGGSGSPRTLVSVLPGQSVGNASREGELALSRTFMDIIPPSDASVKMVPPTGILGQSTLRPLCRKNASFDVAVYSSSGSRNPELEAFTDQFINKSLLHRLKGKDHRASLESPNPKPSGEELPGFEKEYRSVSVLFVKMKDEKATSGNVAEGDGQTVSNKLVQSLVARLLKLIHKHNGVFQQCSVDDKGTTLLVCFGLPPFTGSQPAVTAVRVALEFLRGLEAGKETKVSLAIASGEILVGIIGCGLRKEAGLLGEIFAFRYPQSKDNDQYSDEFVKIGDAVNLAARILDVERQPETIAIDAATVETVRGKFECKTLGKFKLPAAEHTPLRRQMSSSTFGTYASSNVYIHSRLEAVLQFCQEPITHATLIREEILFAAAKDEGNTPQLEERKVIVKAVVIRVVIFILQNFSCLLLLDDAQWIDHASVEIISSIIATVEHVVLAQLDRLDPLFQTIVKAASILGQYFSLEDIAFLLDGQDPSSVAEKIKTSDIYRFFGHDEDREDALYFRHITIKISVYESLALSERQKLHLKMAHRLEAILDSQEQKNLAVMASMCHHYWESSDFEKMIKCNAELGLQLADQGLGAEASEYLAKVVQNDFQETTNSPTFMKQSVYKEYKAKLLSRLAYELRYSSTPQIMKSYAVRALELCGVKTPKSSHEGKRLVLQELMRLISLWISTSGGLREKKDRHSADWNYSVGCALGAIGAHAFYSDLFTKEEQALFRLMYFNHSLRHCESSAGTWFTTLVYCSYSFAADSPWTLGIARKLAQKASVIKSKYTELSRTGIFIFIPIVLGVLEDVQGALEMALENERYWKKIDPLGWDLFRTHVFLFLPRLFYGVVGETIWKTKPANGRVYAISPKNRIIRPREA